MVIIKSLRFLGVFANMTGRESPEAAATEKLQVHETQLITSCFLWPDSSAERLRLHVIVLNYLLPESALVLWRRGEPEWASAPRTRRVSSSSTLALPSVTLLRAAADTRICADGGANRIFDALVEEGARQRGAGGGAEAGARGTGSALGAADASVLPHAVLGDLDSIRPDVIEAYRRQGVDVIDLSHDQDSTDLTKCVRHVEALLRLQPQPQQARSAEGRGAAEQRAAEEAAEQHVIVALGALGGRLDQTVANLNTLHMFAHLDIVLWGQGNLARLVRPGTAVIRPDRAYEGPHCGLFPLAGPAVASSSGLRWNVADTRMTFGGLLSTSNIVDADEVAVSTDVPLVWTTEVDDAALLRCNRGRRRPPPAGAVAAAASAADSVT